jgi:hypothetical protein
MYIHIYIHASDSKSDENINKKNSKLIYESQYNITWSFLLIHLMDTSPGLAGWRSKQTSKQASKQANSPFGCLVDIIVDGYLKFGSFYR